MIGITSGAIDNITGVTSQLQSDKLLHKQIRQDKRFFALQYAEAVQHHAQALSQNAQMHAQAHACHQVSYAQSQHLASQAYLQSKLQHRLDFSIALRGARTLNTGVRAYNTIHL